jgi:hypothetical protein
VLALFYVLQPDVRRAVRIRAGRDGKGPALRHGPYGHTLKSYSSVRKIKSAFFKLENVGTKAAVKIMLNFVILSCKS